MNVAMSEREFRNNGLFRRMTAYVITAKGNHMELKSKWARITRDRITSESITEPQLRHMRLKLARAANGGRFSYPESKAPTRDEMAELLRLIATVKPRVSDEQARKGADWLYKQVFTPRGRVRGTEFAREFTDADRAVILELRDKPHFTLNGLTDIGQRDWTVFAPVYNAIGAHSFFRYAAVAWQTGKPFVICHA